MSDLDFLIDADHGCADLPVEMFFPGSNSDGGVEARQVCRACPVQPACLEYALEHPQYGIWGGTSANERRAIAKTRGRTYNVAQTPEALGGRPHHRVLVERLSAQGLSTGEIADKLGISARTVTRHRTGNWGQAVAS